MGFTSDTELTAARAQPSNAFAASAKVVLAATAAAVVAAAGEGKVVWVATEGVGDRVCSPADSQEQGQGLRLQPARCPALSSPLRVMVSMLVFSELLREIPIPMLM